jgi:hypothetical protein
MNQQIPPTEGYPEDARQYMSYHEAEAARRISMTDIKEHITGPVISLIFHAIAISFLGSIIIMEAPQERKDIEVTMTEVQIKEMEKMPEPPPQEEVVEQDIEIERPEVTTNVNVEINDAPAVDALAQDIVMPTVMAIAPSNSALVLPGVMAMRSGAGRKKALKDHGGSDRTEHSVSKGLRWLRDHQNPDGSWGEGCTRAFLTGMALLSFLAHGENPQSQEYGTCILKAIKRLVEMVNNRNGRLVEGDQNTYGHAVVAYALAEAYSLTKIPMVETAMNSMVETLVSGQNSVGGYNYAHKNDILAAASQKPNAVGGVPRTDLSLSGWHFQALKAAFAAGSTTPGIEKAIENSIKCLKTVLHVSSGGFTYANSSEAATATMTAAGTLCLQLLGEGRSTQAKSGIKWMEENSNRAHMKCDWKDLKSCGGGNITTWPLYAWYYQTQALFQDGEGHGNSWKEWNKEFQKALLNEQESDGHWTSPVTKYNKQTKGHGENPETFRSQLGLDIYSTCMCTLMLEVYYRYLPTFKVVAAPATAPATDSSGKKESTGLIIE